MSGEGETITITLEDLKALERLAVNEAKLDILVNDFQKNRDDSKETLNQLFALIRAIPGKITECKDTLEKDIKDTYMTKEAGVLLEQRLTSNTRSIKLWIVSTVTGATGTGIAVLWFFKLLNGS